MARLPAPEAQLMAGRPKTPDNPNRLNQPNLSAVSLADRPDRFTP